MMVNEGFKEHQGAERSVDKTFYRKDMSDGGWKRGEDCGDFPG
jgi:hypothetical protein